MSVASGDARGDAKAPLRRETNNRDGAGVHFAFQCEAATMQLCQVPRQRQSQTAALVRPRQAAVDLTEAFKRLWQVFFRNADPCIANLQLNRTGLQLTL